MSNDLDELERRRRTTELVEMTETAAPGRLTARARIDALADPGSVFEIGALSHSQHPPFAAETPADGLHTAFVRVAGHEVLVLAENGAARANSDGQVAKLRRRRALLLAHQRGLPVVVLAEGPIHRRTTDPFSGELPGRMADPRVRSTPAAAQPFTIVGIFGPLGAETRETLGHADVVVATTARDTGDVDDSGTAIDATFRTDVELLTWIRHLMTCLLGDTATTASIPAGDAGPGRPRTGPPFVSLLAGDDAVVHGDPTAGAFTGAFARIGGRPVVLAVTGAHGHPSVLTIACVDRLCRLIRLADRLRLPLVLVQDCAGYSDELATHAAAAARLADAYATATAPRLAVVVGDGHVLGRFAMGSHEHGLDVVLALVGARLGAQDVDDYRPAALDARREPGPWVAAGLGLVDEVLAPDELPVTLARLIAYAPRD